MLNLKCDSYKYISPSTWVPVPALIPVWHLQLAYFMVHPATSRGQGTGTITLVLQCCGNSHMCSHRDGCNNLRCCITCCRCFGPSIHPSRLCRCCNSKITPIHAILSSVELSWPVDVQQHGQWPAAPLREFASGTQTLADTVTPQLLGWFAPCQVLLRNLGL